MKIGVISDTHGGMEGWKLIKRNFFSKVDLLIHAGDLFYHGVRNPLPPGYDTLALAEEINNSPLPLLICRGNCDSEVDQLVINFPIQSPYLFLQLEGLPFLVHHGHLLSEKEILALTQGWSKGLVISGHTHIPHLEKKGKLIFLNPGSPSLPKAGNPSAGLIEIKPAPKEVFLSLGDLSQDTILDSLKIAI